MENNATVSLRDWKSSLSALTGSDRQRHLTRRGTTRLSIAKTLQPGLSTGASLYPAVLVFLFLSFFDDKDRSDQTQNKWLNACNCVINPRRASVVVSVLTNGPIKIQIINSPNHWRSCGGETLYFPLHIPEFWLDISVKTTLEEWGIAGQKWHKRKFW